jgi:hypothetical protein
MTRYLPMLVAEIFGGHYFVTLHPDGTCTVTTWSGREWIAARRR